MIKLALLALAMTAQSGEEAEPSAPAETEALTIEYPYIIESYVVEYQDCLKAGAYIIGDGSGFEEQYRLDIPRCDKLAVTLLDQTKARLARSRDKGIIYDYDPDQIFETARKIHVLRGRNLDNSLSTRVDTTNPDVPPARLSPECTARLKSLDDERQAFMDTEGPRVEKIHSQSEFTDEDRRAIFGYQARLGEYNTLISFERRKCQSPSVQQDAVTMDDANE